jgi:hypothetical protein
MGLGADSTDVAAAVTHYFETERASLLDTVSAAADAVESNWGGESTTDRDAVVGAFASELRARDALVSLPGALVGAVAAADRILLANPVPAPPYVVFSSRGPVLRATLSDGRLVVTLCVFDIDHTGETPRYVRAPDGVTVDVEFVQ